MADDGKSSFTDKQKQTLRDFLMQAKPTLKKFWNSAPGSQDEADAVEAAVTAIETFSREMDNE